MSLELARSVTDEQMKAAALVVLPNDALGNLSSGEIDVLKMRQLFAVKRQARLARRWQQQLSTSPRSSWLRNARSGWQSQGRVAGYVNEQRRAPGAGSREGIFAAVPEVHQQRLDHHADLSQGTE